MSISAYIKEIGRGKDGARPLDRAQSRDLMAQVLDGQATDLEVGAFAVAMRIKGETTDELAGFLDAVTERCVPLQAPGPAVVLPSYNGARKLPNLTPLLALMLAQEGVPVLVHGMPEDPTRVTTAEVFHDLGLPAATSPEEAAQAWARREPVYMRTDRLCPPLARLLDARWVIGLRNPAHTVAKLLDPFSSSGSVRIVNYTHPEYAHMHAAFLQHIGANAVLMRGTEGEPVADARRLPKLDVFVRGEPRPDLSLGAHEGVLRELPVLPRTCDAPTTALYIQSVLSGEKPAPEPLLRQVDCLLKTLAAVSGTPAAQAGASASSETAA
ncbi:DNA-binding protein YbiB [Rhizobacter sp. LjRoot28]|uniref:DNA-binding protein YbiB n=1 Tax=Rhizobacter sp. LjRoot28 TaxID=3342309 RepID=UPI003ECE7DAE